MASPEHPFVGRAAECAALSRHHAAACDGAGRLVLVTGEAGIGKTRLVEHVLGGPGTPGVVWGRCHEESGAPVFWPWIEALRPLIASASAERLRSALPGGAAAELARLLPELAPHLAGREPAPSPAPGSPAARFRLFDAITTFLGAMAVEPLVVVLDDLHWADDESLLLLRFLGPEVRQRHLLIVATCRDNELGAVHDAASIRADLTRLAEHLPLSGLTAHDIEAYARATSGVGPGAGVIRTIHGATAGNPFFVTELLDILRREGRLEANALHLDELQLPAGLREAALRRLSGLDGETRALLQLAALGGPEIDVALVANAAGIDTETALGRLGPAFAAGVLREPTTRVGAPRFAHDLIAEALRAELAPDVRCRLHLALADALESLRAHSLDEVAADVARHLVRARPLADPARALAYSARAGEQALRVLGYEDAVLHLAQALELARDCGAPASRRVDLLSRLAEARLAAGDDDGARNAAVEAAIQARETGDRRRFAQAAALASAARSETGQPDHEVIALLEEAERESARDDRALRALVLAPLARELYFVDRTRRLAASAEALEHAREAGEASLLAAALGARHLALWEPGRAAERLALADERLALAERSQDAQIATHAHAWRIADLLELGRLDDADEGLRRYEALAARVRLPRLTWHVVVGQASRALRQGRLDEAERLAQEAVVTWRGGPQNNVAQFYAVQLFLLREEQGRLAELDESLRAFAAGSALPAWQAAAASLHAVMGRHEEARRILFDLGGRLDELPFDGTWISTLARLAIACSVVDAPEVAAALLPKLEPYAGDDVVIGAGVAWLGSVARYVGLLALAAGRVDQSIHHLEAALAANRDRRAPVQAAHVLAALARSYRARGDATRAQQLEDEAGAAARDLGLGALQRDLAGRGVPVAVAANARPVEPAPHGASVARLRREGDGWLITHGEETTRIRDMKGVRYLLVLLREPGREFHALDVVGEDLEGDASERADSQLRRAHRERLAELRADLDEANERNDVGAADRIQDEIASLASELERIAGLDDRPRRAGSIAERARLNATRAIRKVIDRIAAECPRLGHHLSNSVRTGRICCYRTDPTFAVTWEL